MKTNTSQSNFSFRMLMVILVTLGFLIMPGLSITSALADEDLSGSVKISNNCLVFPNPISGIIYSDTQGNESVNQVEFLHIQGKQVLIVDHPCENDLRLKYKAKQESVSKRFSNI